ncbi:hypothetical protein PR048_008601 [Dryococelus australis]|uniref:Uncharacterized protein n=1 Tax=Dryococelus australis TaxID=614101 RepID=A0ABQ9HXJ6_9NEOP|nr:hypothetical protein PR048_008601 [Dryococelus australis]
MCVSSLQTLFGEHVLHVQCWAHKLALVGSVMSCALQDVNEAVVKYLLDIISFKQGGKVENCGIQFLVSMSSRNVNVILAQ